MKKIISIILILGLIIFLPARSYAWYDTDFTKRVVLEINPNYVASTLTNFPVYLDLSDLGDLSSMISGCGDIRVVESDDSTETPREVVTCDTGADTGELHFLADSISSSATTTFYIYYGNSGASDYAIDATYGTENVWNSNYQAVYHFQGDPSSGVLDSTSNDNDGTASNMDSGNQTTGKLAGDGYDFNGSDEQIKDTDQVWSDANDTVTVQMWSNFASADGGQNATIFRYTTSGNERNSAHSPWSNTVYWDFGTCCSSPGRVSGSYTAYDDKYSMLHFVTGASNHTIYIDGSSVYSVGSADNPNTDLTGLAIGSGVDTEYHNGVIDEFRVNITDLGADWISAEYTNQNTPNNFYWIGTEEDAPVAGAETGRPLVINYGHIDINNGRLRINN